MKDPYFSRPEVSNSDLSELKKLTIPKGQLIDQQAAFRFGTLIDALITQAHKVNTFARTCEDYVYDEKEMAIARAMHQSFMRDQFCANLHAIATKQRMFTVQNFRIVYNKTFTFYLPVRCMFDLYAELIDLSGEIKSTDCTTQRSFEDSINYFEYDRQGSLYLDMADQSSLQRRNKHMIIGISKHYPHAIFKVPMIRGEKLFNNGQAAYQELAFDYWSKFANWPTPAFTT